LLEGALGQDGRVVILAQHKLQVDMEAVATPTTAMLIPLGGLVYQTPEVAAGQQWERVDPMDRVGAAPA